MEYGHNHIKSLIGADEGLLTTFEAIANNIKGSYLLNEAVNFLDDGNVLLRGISDKNKISLVSLMKKYYMACGEWFIVDNDLDKLLKAAKREIYAINAPNGLRIATKYEVENGVLGLEVASGTILDGLKGAKEYIIGEEKYKLLNLLIWTIEGRLSNYRQAGFKYNYDKEKGLTDTIYDMILRSADSLTRMMEWVSSINEFNLDMQKLKQASRFKYEYPEYAPDEVRADITTKQLLFYLRKNIPRNTKDSRYKEAIHLVLKEQENRFFKLTPLNISFLRVIYNQLVSGVTYEVTNENENSQLRAECEQLLNARTEGLIDRNHFVFKIIDTIQKFGYSNCSKKQYDIIRDALCKVNKQIETQKQEELDNTFILDIDAELAGGESLLDISNALGNGNFQD